MVANNFVFGNAVNNVGVNVFYDFENPITYNGSGTVITDINGSLNSNLINSPTFNNTTPKNFYFDGSTEYIDSVSPLIVGDYITVSAWFKPTRQDVYETIVVTQGAYGSRENGVAIQNRQNGNFWVIVGNWGQGGTVIFCTVTNNEWVNIILTYNNNVLKCYKNGVLVGAEVVGSSYRYLISNRLIIGKGVTGAGEYFNGYIGEAEISNKVLTNLEISNYFNNKRTKYNI